MATGLVSDPLVQFDVVRTFLFRAVENPSGQYTGESLAAVYWLVAVSEIEPSEYSTYA